MKIIGQYRVPFGVESGGHTLNPGFSSTTGIQIRMTRFRNVIYHSNNQTIDVGPGLIGGYSWKTSQYGLSIDNIFEDEVRNKIIS